MDQNDSTFAAQNEKAKSEIVAQIARIVAIYQHVALDGDLEAKYQEAMKKVDL
jgi:hypothetical protein